MISERRRKSWWRNNENILFKTFILHNFSFQQYQIIFFWKIIFVNIYFKEKREEKNCENPPANGLTAFSFATTIVFFVSWWRLLLLVNLPSTTSLPVLSLLFLILSLPLPFSTQQLPFPWTLSTLRELDTLDALPLTFASLDPQHSLPFRPLLFLLPRLWN